MWTESHEINYWKKLAYIYSISLQQLFRFAEQIKHYQQKKNGDQ